MNKNSFSEADVKSNFITHSITKADWNEQTQIGREISIKFTITKKCNKNTL